MTEVKHTPGPWLIEEDDHEEEFEIYPQKDGPPPLGRWAEICTVKDYHGSPKANAHLIAAAPDLLEALKAAVSALEWWEREHQCCSGATDEQMAIINAAIAKAEGRA